MAYTFRYRIKSAPKARIDGSGHIDHDIWAIFSNDGGETWVEMPERHKTVCVPYEQLNAALAQSTNPLRVAAYKDALASNLYTQPVPNTGWTAAQLLTFMEANDATQETATAADTFILSVWPTHEYPVDFDM